MLDAHYTDPFWEGLEEGTFRVQRCDDCGTTYFPPSPICPACHGTDVAWTEVDGTGNLYAFTRQRRTAPGFDAPIVFGTVELDEDVRLLALIDADYDDLAIGQRVELDPIEYTGGFDRGRLADRPYFAAVPTDTTPEPTDRE